MKTKNKTISTIVVVTVALSILVTFSATVGATTWTVDDNSPAKKNQKQEFSLPEHAVEVSSGVFYLGESMDKGKIVEEYIFIHYAKGHEPVKKVKPVDDGCYSFISKDMEWKVVEDYLINPTNSGLSETFVVETVNLAISEWEKEDYGGFDIFGESSIDDTMGFGSADDGKNTLSFGDYDRDGVIAVCRVSGIFRGPPSNREITEFDVMFDIDFTWGDGAANPLVMDLQNIATHELGHAVGLGDLYKPECSDETMYGYSNYGDIHARDLYYGDIAGLNILYGE